MFTGLRPGCTLCEAAAAASSDPLSPAFPTPRTVARAGSEIMADEQTPQLLLEPHRWRRGDQQLQQRQRLRRPSLPLSSFPVEDLELIGHMNNTPSSTAVCSPAAHRRSAPLEPHSPGGVGDGRLSPPTVLRPQQQQQAATVDEALPAGGLLTLLFGCQVEEEAGRWPHTGELSLTLLAACMARRFAGAYAEGLCSAARRCAAARDTTAAAVDDAATAAALGVRGVGRAIAACGATAALGALLCSSAAAAAALLRLAAAAVVLAGAGAMTASAGAAVSLAPARAAVALLAFLTATGGVAAGALLSAATLLRAVGLLVGTQALLELRTRRMSCLRELRWASLVWRAWLVAAAGVLGGGRAAATTALLWAQKAHLLLELHLLLRGAAAAAAAANVAVTGKQRTTQQRQQLQRGACKHQAGSSTAAAPAAARTAVASATAVTVVSNSGNGGNTCTGSGSSNTRSSDTPAWLLCLCVLLHLLLLLHVPPAPLAAASLLPAALRAGLMWLARSLLAGCTLQLCMCIARQVVSGAAPLNLNLLLLMDPQRTLPSGNNSTVVQDECSSVHRGDGLCNFGLVAGCASSEPWQSGCHGQGSMVNAPLLSDAAAGGCSTSSSNFGNGGGNNSWNCYSSNKKLQDAAPLQLQLAPVSQAQPQFSRCWNGPTTTITTTQHNTPPSAAAAAAATTTTTTTTAAAAVAGLARRHVGALSLLAISAGGDALIAAALPLSSSAAAELAPLRAAWAACVCRGLIAAFLWESVAAVRHEAAVAQRMWQQRAAWTTEMRMGYSTGIWSSPRLW
jgi:hypothetical protein